MAELEWWRYNQRGSVSQMDLQVEATAMAAHEVLGIERV